MLAEVRHRYRVLRRIYKCYSCNAPIRKNESIEIGMSRKEFERLLVHIGQLDADATPFDKKEGRIGRDDVDKIWKAEPKNKHGKMSPTDFVTSIVRVAEFSFWFEAAPGYRICELIGDDILEQAQYVNPAEFRQLIYRDAVNEVFMEYRQKLSKIFKHYQALKKDTHMSAEVAECTRRNCIVYSQFSELMADVQVADAQCTSLSLQHAFTKMLDDADMGAANFKQFREIICVVAVLKNPAPYIPLEIRLRGFFVGTLFPALRKLVGLRGVPQSGKCGASMAGSPGKSMKSMKGVPKHSSCTHRGAIQGTTDAQLQRASSKATMGRRILSQPVDGAPPGVSPERAARMRSQFGIEGEEVSSPTAGLRVATAETI